MWVLWLLLGGLVGGLNSLLLYRTVSCLRPSKPPGLALVLGSVPLRWAIAAVVLALALRQGIGPGLLTFAGMWLTRWGLVILVGIRPEAFLRTHDQCPPDARSPQRPTPVHAPNTRDSE